VLAGSMGSSERLEYAIMGDTVNCASRIEGLEKDRHDGICRILVSGSTFALLYPNGRGDDGLVWERWGEFQLKGRQEPLEIWELREGPEAGAAPITTPPPLTEKAP
jgi:adenylate cyclase